MTAAQLAALLALSTALVPGPRQAPTEDLYPPARVDTAIRFYTLDGGEVELGKLEPALAELGEDASVLYGPVNAPSRPQDWFVAVQMPATVDAKTALKAMKKGTGRAEQLLCTAMTFELGDLKLPNQGPRVGSVRDQVIGMASEMRWAELTPVAVLFFYTDGIDAEDVIDRFDKLRGAKPRSEYERDLLEHTAIWNLSAPPEMEVRKTALRKLEKSLLKLDGVVRASIDPDMLRLYLTLRIEDLAVSGPGWVPPRPPADEDAGGEGGGRAGRGGAAGAGEIGFVPRVLVNTILDEIEDAGLQAEDEGASGETEESR